MSVIDWATTAGRTAAAAAALPARLARQAVAGAARAGSGGVQMVLAVLRGAGIRRPTAGARSHTSPAAAPPPTAAVVVVRQPPADPAAAATRAFAHGASRDGIEKPGAAQHRSIGSARTSGQGRRVGAATPADIRAWATANGYEIGSRGRVPETVRRAYAAAH
jgi:hypothetical protein